MPDTRKVVFAGKTDAGEEIVLYVEEPNEKDFVLSRVRDRLPARREFYLKLPNGTLWALSNAKITAWEDEDLIATHVKIESLEWTGTATGTRADLLNAEREHDS